MSGSGSPGIPCVVEHFEMRESDRADGLSETWDVIAAHANVQSTRAWLGAAERAALPAQTQPLYLECRGAALFPMAVHGTTLASLTTPYSTLYQPLVTAKLDEPALEYIGEALGRVARRFAVTRLDALDPTWPPWTPVLRGAQRAGLLRQNFRHFGNWFESVTDWEAYLARRPGSLRETIRRKSAAARRDPDIRLELINSHSTIGPALDAYHTVYARSWKQAEPFPNFNATLLPRLAAIGGIRLGLMWVGARPVAAQYWTVWDGIATVLKLAHDEEFKAQSPGTVLTAWMIQRLIDKDGVTEIDFGRGDDPYKRLWVSERRQRTGALLINPRRVPGLVAWGRHTAGRVHRILARRSVTEP